MFSRRDSAAALLAAALVVLAVIPTGAAGGAAATDAPTSSQGDRLGSRAAMQSNSTDSGTDGSLGSCFPGEGERLSIGEEGPHIELAIYTSLLANLGGRGALGMAAVGSTGQYDVISLQVGVLFRGIGDPAAFVTDPFSRYALIYEYDLRLRMLPDVPTYEDDNAPVDGPTGDEAC